MKLICSQKEAEHLIKLGVLKVKAKDEYYIETKPNIIGEIHMILVSVSNEIEANSGCLDVDRFLKAFPTPLESKNMLVAIDGFMSRSLRSGVKDKMQKKLNELSKKYSPDEILGMVAYEVKKRVESSLINNRNELQYMQAAGSWLNNDANIEALYEECIELQSNSKPDNYDGFI